MTTAMRNREQQMAAFQGMLGIGNAATPINELAQLESASSKRVALQKNSVAYFRQARVQCEDRQETCLVTSHQYPG